MMTISARGRYSVRMLVMLASRPPKESVTKQAIAEAEGISPAYVVQLMMLLRAAGLVVSHRGRTGGFTLARSPQTITLADVLRTVEGDIRPAPCIGTEDCKRMDTCAARPVWVQAASLLNAYLEGITLADLAKPEGSAGPDLGP